ncbi:hypothetical protein BT63DRAFT_421048 [Microthyrium microscopicum]|uniref:Uncharacterized protein n=1 Tax=Microthyrium microscopicum TaxID=703497 RepID=A0A6A6UN05_9PEZI|nr:hypothetical protein BT63DRAFT_421048 [Microthyrium microscopicum]
MSATTLSSVEARLAALADHPLPQKAIVLGIARPRMRSGEYLIKAVYTEKPKEKVEFCIMNKDLQGRTLLDFPRKKNHFLWEELFEREPTHSSVEIFEAWGQIPASNAKDTTLHMIRWFRSWDGQVKTAPSLAVRIPVIADRITALGSGLRKLELERDNVVEEASAAPTHHERVEGQEPIQSPAMLPWQIQKPRASHSKSAAESISSIEELDPPTAHAGQPQGSYNHIFGNEDATLDSKTIQLPIPIQAKRPVLELKKKSQAHIVPDVMDLASLE